MANDKKPEGGKAPAKVETINLKVFIHCEGCKKKVKKILNNVEGVHTVDVDGSLGKVTVTGTVDSKMLIKKLEKAGKVAEVLASGGGGGSGKGKEQQKDQQKGENKEAKEEKSGGGEGDKKGKGGGGGSGGGNGGGDKKGQGNNNGGGDSNNNKGNNSGGDSNNNKGNNSGGGSANSGESGKKKKGGGGDGDGGNGVDGFDEAGPNKNTANKNIAPIMVETGYSSMESAEYATHIFSDENANNCHIM